MGQSTSTVNNCPMSLSPVFVSDDVLADEIAISSHGDYTKDIPDDCLAYVFQFLAGGDRSRCSLVCKRWLRVEGQSRYRLSLNARAGILSLVPSLFERFDSVSKLSLRCDRKSFSLNDEALAMISVLCRKITRLKLHGCRQITDLGMAVLAQNCKSLKKVSFGSCTFGAKGMNAVLDQCSALEELSIKRLRGIYNGNELIRPSAAASSLKSICLKDLVNGQIYEPLVIGCKELRTLRIIRCFGDWDKVLGMIGSENSLLTEIRLEKLQVSDLALVAISKCLKIEILHMVKTAECSNSGIVSVAASCKQLRKLRIDGWRMNRIGDEGLIAIGKHCLNLQELVLIGVNATHLSLTAIAANCRKLERLALCGSLSIGDSEIACIAAKCLALKKLCIGGCAISNVGIEAIAWGCPSLIKVKVKKCRGVSTRAMDWLQGRRASLVVNFDSTSEMEVQDSSGNDAGGEESGMDFSFLSEVVVLADGRREALAG
ncbi:hypothetical protein K2173_021262 [Erythroxylum novogranatense]|uniref:F-box domain-containing protein n=1 Tax=Erythroxylum novogranatense TaxID=1862640 RepID=A0AAV8TWR6_9ROSI|nr:hypothetical protein K2173_021262 [Erythroxylum novogranatense]